MEKETKRRIKITILGIIGVLMLLIGVSFAAFSSDLAGTKIQGMQTGCLKVEMTDNGSVNMTNEAPISDEAGLAKTPYTYTLKNTCTTDAFYTATINVMDSSNLENISKIKVALEGDSYLAPTIESNLEEMASVDTSETGISKTYKLDEGYLKKGEEKTFNLRTWIDYDVTSITGSIENKVIVLSEAREGQAIEYNTNTSGYDVLKEQTILTEVNYQEVAEESGIVRVEEDDNVKYYFRGNPNNNLTFGGLNFKVLSTNNDGSINLVLNDTIGTSTYSNIETTLNNWYDTNIEENEKYIKIDQTYCEEKESTNGAYLGGIRVENSNPSIIYTTPNKYTKVGILTADDVMYAGGVTKKVNTSFYLNDSNSYFLSTFKAANTIYTYRSTDSISEAASDTTWYVKPVITLKSNVMIKGKGTTEEPFYVGGLYEEQLDTSDKIAPEIIDVRIDARWSKENKSIKITGKDNNGGSGIGGYIVKTTNTKPDINDSAWEGTSGTKYETVNKYDNGTYYVFMKDNAGNVSEGKEITVSKVDKIAPTCSIRINPNGTAAAYKTLSIMTEEENIDLKGYSWDHSETTEDVIKVTEAGVYTGHITDLAGNQGSCSGTVINIVDPNPPILDTNMIPVYYDETSETWKKADESNKNKTYQWYDYDNKMWANSVTVSSTNRTTYLNASPGTEIDMEDILTMQVWVPRYKYKVWNYNSNGTSTSEPQEIEIVFEEGTASTGEIECTDTISGTDGAKSESCKINNTECTDSTCNNKYYTHPAFTFGSEELTGFWIGKFELTGTISSITTKPDLSSIRSQNVSSFEANIMKMNDNGNQYGFSTNADTHMIKNMEWGAVSYLSHSKYGVNREVYINNSSGYYTGRSGGNVGGSTPINGTYTDQTSTTQYNSYGFYTYDGYLLNYNTNTKSTTKDLSKVSSTTGNIYGVYDMSGGAIDYVMGNIVSNNGTTMMSGNSTSSNSGYTGIIYDRGNYTSYTGTYNYPETKYYDKYSYGTSSSQRIRSKLGDGIKEVLNTSSLGWYSDISNLAYSYYPWFYRGGDFNGGSGAGMFISSYDFGNAYTIYSSRLVITP